MGKSSRPKGERPKFNADPSRQASIRASRESEPLVTPTASSLVSARPFANFSEPPPSPPLGHLVKLLLIVLFLGSVAFLATTIIGNVRGPLPAGRALAYGADLVNGTSVGTSGAASVAKVKRRVRLPGLSPVVNASLAGERGLAPFLPEIFGLASSAAAAATTTTSSSNSSRPLPSRPLGWPPFPGATLATTTKSSSPGPGSLLASSSCATPACRSTVTLPAPHRSTITSTSVVLASSAAPSVAVASSSSAGVSSSSVVASPTTFCFSSGLVISCPTAGSAVGSEPKVGNAAARLRCAFTLRSRANQRVSQVRLARMWYW